MSPASPTYRFGPFELRPAQRSLLAGGTPVAIGGRAFDVLLALLERRERVVGAEELLELAWPGLVVEENNLRQQVAALRRLLGADAIVTVAGRGYRWGTALAEESTAAGPASPGALHNLPQNLPALIGRAAELASVLALCARTPLLTLVGPGGVGKTRLALAVAEQLRGGFKDGVWRVELAPIADPALLIPVVAGALGVHEEPERPLLDTLLDFLRGAQLLIVLDNCEHLIEAAARWTERCLQAGAGVRVLATSREPLAIAGEQVWRVQTLPAPDLQARPSPEQLLAYPAAQLFVLRAAAADPCFAVTAANAGAVARICQQLDGLPLALELAAARLGSMRVEQVAERLHDRFTLLSRGSRTALERHQTLRALVDWSHELLAPAEATLLRRLAVFSGGWSLEAAEAVCADARLAPGDVLELLAALVEKSLALRDGQASQPRYRMLETIRAYALQKLQAAGEEAALRSRHLQHLVGIAEAMREPLAGADQLRWHALAEAERDNIRAALHWAEQSAQPELGLRILNALHRHWYKTMSWGEVAQAQQRLAARLEALGRAPDEHLARSYVMAGMLATNLRLPTGRALCEQALAISNRLDFDEGRAWAQMWLAHLDQRRRDPATAEQFEASLRSGERIEDPWRRAYFLANAYICYANYEAAMGRDASAQAKLQACEAQIAASGDDPVFLGHARTLQATMAIRRGDLERAQDLAAQGLALHRAVDAQFNIGAALAQQGLIALQQGDPRRALALFEEGLALHRRYPQSQWVTKGLAQLLIAHAGCGHWQVAARLAGVLARPGAPAGTPPPELSSRVARSYADAVQAAQAALGDAAFVASAGGAAALTREQALELALGGQQAGLARA